MLLSWHTQILLIWQAIQLSSEEREEEMSSMTRQAFITTASQYGSPLKIDASRMYIPFYVHC